MLGQIPNHGLDLVVLDGRALVEHLRDQELPLLLRLACLRHAQQIMTLRTGMLDDIPAFTVRQKVFCDD